jgi:hypothetical protein
MAQPPPIPEKPADRLETREEYLRRRAAIGLRRWFWDELVKMLRNPIAVERFMEDFKGSKIAENWLKIQNTEPSEKENESQPQ